MNRTMLIAGCSHAAGLEIITTDDSTINRQKSFGNLLANKIGYTPVNIATSGCGNVAIARSVIEWVNSHHDPENTELVVLIAWTESSRMEIPSPVDCYYKSANMCSDDYSFTNDMFLRINFGMPTLTLSSEDKSRIEYYQEFMANNLSYLEILSANYILQLEYFLKMKNIKYAMCETMQLFSENRHIKPYLDMIDTSYYMNFNNKEESFWWKYKNLGFVNENAKYWHHSSIPHELFAESLLAFIDEGNQY